MLSSAGQNFATFVFAKESTEQTIEGGIDDATATDMPGSSVSAANSDEEEEEEEAEDKQEE